MNQTNTPAPAGKAIRVLITASILSVIVAGAGIMPVTASPGTDSCTTCGTLYDWRTGDYWLCLLTHLGEVCIQEPPFGDSRSPGDWIMPVTYGLENGS
jgi:hypothetical protein